MQVLIYYANMMVKNMIDEDRGIYTTGTMAKLIGEHPETLRVWERNGLITPLREGTHRKYSNNDFKRLAFIKHLIDQKGLNIAGVKQIIIMYPCWSRKNCEGGALNNGKVPVNSAKPCWKRKETFCLVAADKSEWCSLCPYIDKCKGCSGCPTDKSEIKI